MKSKCRGNTFPWCMEGTMGMLAITVRLCASYSGRLNVVGAAVCLVFQEFYLLLLTEVL